MDFVWYSTPGALALAPAVILYFVNREASTKWAETAAIFFAAAPFAGFGVHQLVRVVFECRWAGGYARKSRKVVTALLGRASIAGRQEAALIWELAFYDARFPEPFREHNRRQWHFTFSFWSSAAGATVGWLLAVALWLLVETAKPASVFLAVGGAEFVLTLVFWKKAGQTYRSMTEQEEALLRIHRKLFDEIVRSYKSDVEAAEHGNTGAQAD